MTATTAQLDTYNALIAEHSESSKTDLDRARTNALGIQIVTMAETFDLALTPGVSEWLRVYKIDQRVAAEMRTFSMK